ncbi:hypothetical protein [Actinacidiphila paucisporea]|uniref:Uncharacterized protein n=1 Tax=Actinacidiphila paucisporea TaxID=310782 RepID=A0A1M7IT60_9ACTN|nr:hypothetical protein [Actinacidiphila paucisporea]SHM43788.1 hypothetical protein SAMN05216499_11124 [Actinacidiphila paucisporea]
MPEFEDALSTALRQAAEAVLPDSPLRLVSEAHAQGRRIRRRRKAAIVTTAAAVAAAVAVGGTVVATSLSGGHRTDAIAAGRPTPPSGQRERDARMHDALTTLLTPGTLTGIRTEDSAASEAKEGQAPAAGVAAKFTDSRGTAVVSVFVTRKPAGAQPMGVCPPARVGASDGPCHVFTYKDGRTIVSQVVVEAPDDWLASTYETGDYQVAVNQLWLPKPGAHSSGLPTTVAPLTVAQLTSIAESDLWRTIAAGMPVPPRSATLPFRLIETTPWS